MTKIVSTDIELLETARIRKPVDLYDFWNPVTEYHITSADVSLVFDGNTYTPAYIGRGRTSHNTDLTVSRLEIDIDKLQAEVKSYITGAPLDETWVRVMKIFRNQDPPEAMVYFIGTVARVRIKGSSATLECDGLEKALSVLCPRLRYQRLCPLSVYSDECGVAAEDFAASVNLSEIADDEITLTSVDFALQVDDWWKMGWLEWGGYRRMIVSHVGSQVVLRHKIPGLTGTDTVTVYAGCDKTMSSCRDKFLNLNNIDLDRFFGFPYLPFDNPSMWT